MIWIIKLGDIISFSQDIYKYEIKNIYRNRTILENLLTHKITKVKISTIKKKAKIERRMD
jgi:hypothetical protein